MYAVSGFHEAEETYGAFEGGWWAGHAFFWQHFFKVVCARATFVLPVQGSSPPALFSISEYSSGRKQTVCCSWNQLSVHFQAAFYISVCVPWLYSLLLSLDVAPSYKNSCADKSCFVWGAFSVCAYVYHLCNFSSGSILFVSASGVALFFSFGPMLCFLYSTCRFVLVTGLKAPARLVKLFVLFFSCLQCYCCHCAVLQFNSCFEYY